MKKVKLVISFILFMLFTSSQVKAVCTPEAKDIPVREKGSHIGTRTSELSVIASLEQGLLTVNVSHYIGIVKIYVYDANGILMTTSSVLTESSGWCSLDLSSLEQGPYKVTIELGDITYWGMLNI